MWKKSVNKSTKLKINFMLDGNCFTPRKAHDTDAGFDLYSPIDFKLDAHSSYTVDLGVHFEIPEGYVGFLKSKSGLNVHNGILCEGVIDSGYTGSIVAKLYNNSNNDYYFYTGQKVTQIVFLPIPSVELNLVNTFVVTERGSNGFGSTGR